MAIDDSDNEVAQTNSENEPTSEDRDESCGLDNDEWKALIKHIEIGRCAPFIGAGACHGTLQMGTALAREWAEAEGFPLNNLENLPQVTQYIAVKNKSPLIPKQMMLEKLAGHKPDYEDLSEPHRVLANLPFPIYLTTNYDGFITGALEHVKKKPVRDYCRWNQYLESLPSDPASEWSDPNPENPVVYHLHGYDKLVDSLVLIEDDYLDFLVNLTQKEDLIPLRIQQTMAGSSLLFLGYALQDLDFQVIFRWLQGYLGRSIAPNHVSVQLIPGQDVLSREGHARAQEYLNHYFNRMNISIFWGTCRKFVSELKKYWKKFNDGHS